MTITLNKFQKQLCNVLQEPLPICAGPFEAIAEKLATDESTVISETEKLKSLGLIRRFSASVNYRALGKAATLVTAHVPEKDLVIITTVINALPGVSHNYLRDHHYNLWFTLQADTDKQLQTLLTNLSKRLDTQFHPLPAIRLFKLNVRFNPDLSANAPSNLDPEAKVLDVACPAVGPATLNDLEKNILTKLQCNLEIAPRPFDFLVTDTADIDTVIRTIQSLTDKGVIQRIAAVINHRKLGFNANVMFCAHVEADRITHVGTKLARFKIVSHCYERKTFEGWPYNLFAMMHAQTIDQIRGLIDKFTAAEQIEEFELLTTTAELKKQPVRHDFS
jgi:DNA-binding Lrp family transcriptional regulator